MAQRPSPQAGHPKSRNHNRNQPYLHLQSNLQVLPLTGAAFRTALKGLMDKSNKGRLA